jgi:cytosine/adenosine deaminase-related metal-dependent hydrolase
MRPLRLTARWALPIDQPPIPDAAVLIGPEGRIVAVGPDAVVLRPDGVESLELGTAVLLPGLVNAHTHLELTGFEDAAPQPGFRDWIVAIRGLMAARSPIEFLEAARRGVRDCWAAGVTTIADTGDSGAVPRALAELGGSGIAYHEVFGPDPAQLGTSVSGLRHQMRELAPFAAGRVRLGVSPHAPYTVSGPLYAEVAAWAAAQGFPIAVHIAESREETEFVSRGTGPFAEAWKAREIPLLDHPSHQPSSRPPVRPSTGQESGRSAVPPTSPTDWLDGHGVLGPGTLCIHAVQVDARDIERLALRAVAVAHCPLSNRRHGHGAAPLAELRRAGLRVGIGTDSVASVGRLDLLAEARAARDLAGLSEAEALELCTRDGGRALGLDSEIGSLTPGKWGDVIALCPPAVQPSGRPAVPPFGLALASTPEDVVLTVLGGRIVHRRPPA